MYHAKLPLNAIRSLTRAPGFAAAVVASLALGLAFVTTILAIVNAYLLRPLPYRGAGDLYHVQYAPPGPFEPAGIAAMDWTALNDVIEAPIITRGETYYLGDGYSSPARGLRVGPAVLAGLGVQPVVGRTFAPADYATGSETPALIGQTLWRSRFAGDSGIIGRVIRVGTENSDAGAASLRVIGILPAGFWLGRESSNTIDVVVPLQAPAPPTQAYMVRIRPGTNPSVVERRLTEMTRRITTGQLPADWTGVHLESMRSRYVASVRPVLVGISIAAALVIVIVCANIAVLTLLRAMRRRKELSVRVALGAGRGHIIGVLASETLLLTGTALAIALALSSIALRLLGPIIENKLGRPAPAGAATITLDPAVILIAAAGAFVVALSLALLAGVTPWRGSLAEVLQGSGRSTTDSPALRRARNMLIMFEIAGSIVLLAACGSMVRTVSRMVATDLGFRVEHLDRVGLVVPAREYPDSGALLAYYRRITQRVSALVNSPVVFASWPPYADLPMSPVAIDAQPNDSTQAGYLAVSPGYFALLGVTLRQGREFAESDMPGSEQVAIVSETMARRNWPGDNPVGRRIRTVRPFTASVSLQWRTVIGVAADVRQTYDDADPRDVYVPYYQSTPSRFGAFYIRTEQPTAQLMERLRTGIAESDPMATVRGVTVVASQDAQLANAKFLRALLSSIAGFALFLALLGIYGVMAYAVRQREREIAIRIAIGATAPRVTAHFLRRGGVVLMIGTMCGVITTIAAHRFLASRIAGLPPFDLWTLAIAAAAMLLCGLLAVWWPARRAASISPLGALDAE